jgi:acyl carrier protein
MAMSREEISEAVQTAVVDALSASPDEVTPEATIMEDLGAESIDLLDILFRLERKVGIKIQAADLSAYVQGGIPDEEMGDENGKITAKGLDQLKKAMPQIDAAELAGKLDADKVMTLFTVQNLADMVAERAGAGAN